MTSAPFLVYYSIYYLDIGIERGFIRAIYEYIRKLPLFIRIFLADFRISTFIRTFYHFIRKLPLFIRIFLADIRIPTFIRTFYHFIRKLPLYIRTFLAVIRILPHQNEKAGRKGPASTSIIMFVQP
jgi:hypothetical protein